MENHRVPEPGEVQIKELEGHEFMARQLMATFGDIPNKQIALICQQRSFDLKKNLPSSKAIQNQIKLFDQKHS